MSSVKHIKDYYVNSSGGRPKDANPKGQKSAPAEKKTTKAKESAPMEKKTKKAKAAKKTTNTSAAPAPLT